MSVSLTRLLVPGLLALALLPTLVQAQAVMPNAAGNRPAVAAGAAGFTPYGYGFNPLAPAGGPLVANAGLGNVNPYALSTVAASNPYQTSAALGTSPYSLSTAPGTPGQPGNAFVPFFNPYQMWGWQDPAGAQLQGLASLTAATGQYYIATQQARVVREQSRQMALDTMKKRVELEAWYETIRPTAARLIDAERANDLDRARKGALAGDIWSGKSLNDLLSSVQKSGTHRLADGPKVALDKSTVEKLNFTTGVGGNAGILRRFAFEENFSLNWPEALREDAYSQDTQKVESGLRDAAKVLSHGGEIASDKKKNIDISFDNLYKKINDASDELAPQQAIEARRFLNQVRSAIRSLNDTNVKAQLDKRTGQVKAGTVAELVDFMSRSGLQFGPANDGDQGAYNAAYLAMRQFEAGLQSK